ncbi:MAG: PAS domain-containing protein, partial [Alphaproteobacteria bacterium]
MLTLLVLIPLVLAAAAFEISTEKNRRQNEARIAAEQIAKRLQDFVAVRIQLIKLEARHIENKGAPSRPDFTRQAETLQSLFPGLQAINWIDSRGVVRWVVPEAENEAVIDVDLSRHPVAGPILARLGARGHVAATPPIELIQGGRGFAVYVPVRGPDGRPVGFLNGVFRAAPMVEAALREDLQDRYHLVITDGDRLLYAFAPLSAPVTKKDGWGQASLHVADRVWTLALHPTPATTAVVEGHAAVVILGLGLVLSGALAALVRLVVHRREELVASERRAAAAESRLREAIEASPSGFSLFDADDRLVLWNTRYAELYDRNRDLLVPGVSFEYLLRQLVARSQFAVSEEDRERWIAERLAHHHNPGGVIEQELADGRWLRVAERRTRDGSIVGIRTDITEIKVRERELAERTAALDTILASVDQGISLVDANLNVIAFNQKFLELLDFPP